MEQLMTFFAELPTWIYAIIGVLTALKAIAVLTPTPKDDEAIGKALAFLHNLISVITVTKQKDKKDVNKD